MADYGVPCSQLVHDGEADCSCNAVEAGSFLRHIVTIARPEAERTHERLLTNGEREFKDEFEAA